MGRALLSIICICLLAHQAPAANPNGFARLADGTIVDLLSTDPDDADGRYIELINRVTGYLSPRRFKEHDHFWTDPQPFIKERMK